MAGPTWQMHISTFFFFGRHSLSNRTKKEESEAFNGSTGSGLFKPLWQTSHPLLLLHEAFSQDSV